MRFKKIKSVFTYHPMTDGLVEHVVMEHRRPTEIVIPSGITGQLIRVAVLDTNGPYPFGYYFTSRQRAIEVFIAKAELALTGPCDAQNRKAWTETLVTARRDLSSQIRTKKNV
jgi:hypothetical protein